MTAELDPDPLRAASLEHMAGHLPGPFAAGAVRHEIELDSTGRARVGRTGPGSWSPREPLVVLALRQDLGADSWQVGARLDPSGANRDLGSVYFDPYTEAGAALLVYRPEVDAVARTVQPFVLALRAFDAGGSELSPARLNEHFKLIVIEGVLGRLLFAVAAEKARLRREARLIGTVRKLETAAGDSLDRIGEELGVPRFTERLEFSAGQIATSTERERDADYRRRLGVYRGFQLSTRRRLLELLNGPGAATDPNRGPLGGLGLAERFSVAEDDNPFAVAVIVVASGPNVARAAEIRDAFLSSLRETHLIAPALDVDRNRFAPSVVLERDQAERELLRTRFRWSSSQRIAPMLAAALGRVARCLIALGAGPRWRVLRAQQNSGSRYQLGLGIELALPQAVVLNRIAARVPSAIATATLDEDTRALLRSMSPTSAALDPEARWLFEPCGLRTVHRLDAGRVYLSHLPQFGLALSGPTAVSTAGGQELEANYHAPGDPGLNAVLVDGLARANAAWTHGGEPAWTVLPAASEAALLAGLVPLPAASEAVIRQAGFTLAFDLARLVTTLPNVPDALLAYLELPAGLTTAVATTTGAADTVLVDRLARLRETLQSSAFASAMFVQTSAGQLLLVVSVIGLPQVGSNLSSRRATGFRWYSVPIFGAQAQIAAVGSKTRFTPTGTGITAVVALGYARQGLTDPYEIRIELPRTARLDLRQYEFLMNILGHSYPIGVEINTYSLRQGNVDLDGDGAAEPLPPAVSRTYRPFRRKRHLGQRGVPVTEEEA